MAREGKPHLMAAAILFASLSGLGSACAFKSSRPEAPDQPRDRKPDRGKPGTPDLNLRPSWDKAGVPDPLVLPSYSSLTEPEEPPSDGADNCRQFWRWMGVRSKLPPLLKDCKDVTLYRNGDARLIFSFPSFITRFS